MSDAIDIIGNSLVQHGSGSELAYLLRLDPADAPDVVEKLEHLACSRGYSKVCAKVPAAEAGRFVAAGYHLEAAIPCFFQQDAACFMAKYFSSERKVERQRLLVREVLDVAVAQQRAGAPPVPAGCTLRVAGEADVVEMADFYRDALACKPAQLHDPAFIRGEMRQGSIFFGLWREGSLAALCCARIDSLACSAEMAFFAVQPKSMADQLQTTLLQHMEQKVATLGIRSVFAQVRAYAFGVNINLARSGYHFGGTLTNNSNLYGRLESVNVWHKALAEDPSLVWGSVMREDGPLFEDE